MPDAIVSVPGQPPATCNDYQNAGYNGFIPSPTCDLLTDFVVQVCGCMDGLPPPTLPPVPNNCPAIPPGGCSVCGPGTCVTAPDNIVTIPGNAPATCGDLENSGLNGFIPADTCAALPPLVTEACDCAAGIPSTPSPFQMVLPTPAPFTLFPPTPAPIAPVPTPAPDPFSNPGFPDCFLCGDGSEIEEPTNGFTFPGQPTISCGSLQAFALNGFISPEACPQLIPFVLQDCGCTNILPPSPPTIAPVPIVTPSPTLAPTIVPTLAPAVPPVVPTLPPFPIILPTLVPGEPTLPPGIIILPTLSPACK